MKKKAQPIIIHVLGQSGRVRDSHMGIMVDGKAFVLNDISNFDELMGKIKTFQGADFGD
jgi:predicted phage-related endonuclease